MCNYFSPVLRGAVFCLWVQRCSTISTSINENCQISCLSHFLMGCPSNPLDAVNCRPCQFHSFCYKYQFIQLRQGLVVETLPAVGIAESVESSPGSRSNRLAVQPAPHGFVSVPASAESSASPFLATSHCFNHCDSQRLQFLVPHLLIL